MKLKLLPILCCPVCRSQFELLDVCESNEEIESGKLKCIDQQHVFPIVHGIPRLLSENLEKNVEHIQTSFSSEWAEVDDHVRAWGRSVQERKDLFEQCFDRPLSSFKDKLILDAGCGHGEVLMALKDCGATIVAMDLSFTVDNLKKRLGNIPASGQSSEYHFIQADITKAPLCEEVFDFVHSAGVLHHTPDTYKAFSGLTKKVKNNGTIYIETYSFDHKTKFQLLTRKFLQAVRVVTICLPHSILHIMCWGLAVGIKIFESVMSIFKKEKLAQVRTLREWELSLFDDFSPKYQYHHSAEEVKGWFSQLGFYKLKKTFQNRNGIGVVGQKVIQQSSDEVTPS